MSKNSFKDLEKEYEREYNSKEDRVHSNIKHSMSLFKFIGNILELYFPKMLGALLGSKYESKVDSKEKPPKYPNQ